MFLRQHNAERELEPVERVRVTRQQLGRIPRALEAPLDRFVHQP